MVGYLHNDYGRAFSQIGSSMLRPFWCHFQMNLVIRSLYYLEVNQFCRCQRYSAEPFSLLRCFRVFFCAKFNCFALMTEPKYIRSNAWIKRWMKRMGIWLLLSLGWLRRHDPAHVDWPPGRFFVRCDGSADDSSTSPCRTFHFANTRFLKNSFECKFSGSKTIWFEPVCVSELVVRRECRLELGKY